MIKLAVRFVLAVPVIFAAGWWTNLLRESDGSARSSSRKVSVLSGRDFTDADGKPVHPRSLMGFLPSLIVPKDDTGRPGVLAVELSRRSADPEPEVRDEKGVRWVIFHGPLQTEHLTLEEEESFGYRVLGRTAGGVDVIMTRDTCQYSGPGHVWILLLRREWVPSPAIAGRAERIQRLSLVGYLKPEWRLCMDSKCRESHFENNCYRHWSPDTKVAGDSLITEWKWDPESWVDPQPERPSTAPAPVVVDLSAL